MQLDNSFNSSFFESIKYIHGNKIILIKSTTLQYLFWTKSRLSHENVRILEMFIEPGFCIHASYKSMKLFEPLYSSRFYNSLSEKGKSYVTTGVVLPSKVVNLVIKRPPNFSFKPGDYIFLNIPSIAYFEWHPFTISSAPEQADTISLHIRAVGHWTNSLYQVYSLTLSIQVY